MSFQEWIGSIISLLGLAALFFLNQRHERRAEAEPSQPEQEDEDEEDAWSEFLKSVGGESKQAEKKLPPPVPKPKVKSKQVKYKPIAVEVEHLELHENNPVVRYQEITKIQRVVAIHAQYERNPRVNEIVKSLPNLRSLMISREILEKPRGYNG